MSNADNAKGLLAISHEPDFGHRELVATHGDLPQIAQPAGMASYNHSQESVPFPMPLTEGAYHLTPGTPEIRWKDFAAYPSPLSSRHDSSSDETDSNAGSGKGKRDNAKKMARAKKELLTIKYWFGKSKNSSAESSSEGRRRPMSMIMDSAKVLADARPHEV